MNKIFLLLTFFICSNRVFSQNDIANTFAESGRKALIAKRYYKAIEDFDKAVSINGNSAMVFHHRGMAKAMLNKHRDAILDYNLSIELDTTDFEVFYNRGISEYNLQDYENAIKDFDKSLILNTSYKDSYLYRGYANVGLKNYVVALKDLNKAISLEPDNGSAYLNRAICNIMIGNNSNEVMIDAEKSIQLNPTDLRGYEIRGQAKYLLKDYDGAIVDFTTVIKKDPKNLNAFHNRMGARLALGLKYSACKDYKRALELGEEPNQEMEVYCN